jgi:phage regulator Rha-like protein
MSNLVFLDPNCIKAIPFTTSEVIAEFAKIKHHAVQQLISKHEASLKKFGIVAFEMRKLSGAGRPETIYHLNEEQATLLITFLKNTEPVINFKVELVKQFYQMRTELQKRQIAKAELKPTRRTLTDEIKDNPEHSEWDYKLFTDLAYKMATGKTAAQHRKERGADKKAVALDYMTSDEIALVEKLTYKIAVLYEMGMDYYQIKAMLLNKKEIGKTA